MEITYKIILFTVNMWVWVFMDKFLRDCNILYHSVISPLCIISFVLFCFVIFDSNIKKLLDIE
jgi:hypothetical protein